MTTTETPPKEDLKCLLSQEEIKGFVILGEAATEVPNWTPLCTYLDGVRWHVLFRHKSTGVYKYMWVHTIAGPEGEEMFETSVLDDAAASKKYKWMQGGNAK